MHPAWFAVCKQSSIVRSFFLFELVAAAVQVWCVGKGVVVMWLSHSHAECGWKRADRRPDVFKACYAHVFTRSEKGAFIWYFPYVFYGNDGTIRAVAQLTGGKFQRHKEHSPCRRIYGSHRPTITHYKATTNKLSWCDITNRLSTTRYLTTVLNWYYLS